MPGRSYNDSVFRFGFNNKEKDDEIEGHGNSLDFGARIYDSRLGRFFTPDPLESKYAFLTPYGFVNNSPILFVDPDGMKIIISFIAWKAGTPVPEVVEYKNGKLFDKSGNEYKGNTEYIQRVKTTLDNLKNLDPKVKEVVSDLENDSKDHVISNVDAQKDTEKHPYIKGSYNRKTDVGGTLTKFVPDIDKQKEDLKDFSDEEILGHELKHGWNKLKKLGDQNNKQMSNNGKTNCEEVDATNFESIIREKQGKGPRTKYGKYDISKGDLVAPKNYRLQKGK